MLLAVVEVMGVIIFILSIFVYFIASGFRFPVFEKMHLVVEREQRKSKINMVIDGTLKKEVPATRLTLVLGFLALLMFLALTHKLFFAVVTSGSMVPTLNRGDMFLVQAIVLEPGVGDIVMFNRPDIYLPVAHRIIGVAGDKIYTGGDASGPDQWVIYKDDIFAQAVQIGGKPIVIPNVGSYFVLDAKELRDIGPYGQEYLFYKNLVVTFKSFALAIVIICTAIYIYLEIGERKGI
jgi:signal peptidase